MSDATQSPSPAKSAGSLFLVTAPSGAGKSSLVKALMEKMPGIELSISTTTRAPRPGEENGREYYFTDRETFLEASIMGEFLETAEVFGNMYGTSKKWVEQKMAAGIDVLLEIDYQGALQIKEIFPQAVGIFILPPTLDTLEERLNKRGQDSQETIQKRTLGAKNEIAQAPHFEYIIINDVFTTALDELCAVVTASRLRFSKQEARHRDIFSRLGIHS
ncbi:MAG: guanylate kinase [Burkholderiales bacterium]|nr:guanylate kinase [Burkholderiales bacterium]